MCSAFPHCTGYFHEQDLDTFDKTMQLNYMGTVNCVKSVYDDMVQRRKGHICFVSSTLGIMGEDFTAEVLLPKTIQ